MKTETVKGFNDFTGEEAVKRNEIKKVIAEAFESFGFEPAETPMVEYEEFLRGDKSQDKDEAISDIFRLKDRGKRNLALRYEFTFQLKRIMQNKKLPYKRYQIGEVFRDEPATSNRFRQFTQCDADVISSTIKDEAEILALSNGILTKLGVKPIILVNNRQLLNEILESENIEEKDRTNVLREIDKADKISEKEIKKNLKKYKAEKILDLIKKGEVYFKRFSSYQKILELMRYCNYYNVKVLFSPSIVRGLSYYNGTVFEIKAQGIKETLVGGGSYMFNGVQCTGISFGLERISQISNVKIESDKYLVVSLNQDKEAIKLAEKLRTNGKKVSLFYGKPSKALEYANAYNFSKVVFVGEKEVKVKGFKVKDMKTGRESILKI